MRSRLQRTVSPIDGSVYVERPIASGADIESALSAAARSRPGWKNTSIAERAAICARMVDWCVERADVLGEELTRQMGRPVTQSPGEIRRGFQERARYMCG